MNSPPADQTYKRENFIDELRGLALLGIVLVNAPFLGSSTEGFTDAALTGWLNRAAAFLVVAFAQAKFYLLFSFLFGYSLSFIIKPDRIDGTRKFKRRLLGLGILGIVHAVFFFPGDILLVYALFGCSLLWLHKQPDRTVLKIAASTLLFWILVLAAIIAWLVLTPRIGPAEASATMALAQTNSALAHGTFIQATIARLHVWPSAFLLIGTLNAPAILAMFALGLVAGRHKLLSDQNTNTELWRKAGNVGLYVGLPLGILSGLLAIYGDTGKAAELVSTVGIVLGFISAPLLTLGYLAWLRALKTWRADSLRFFRRAGQMSLTSYIGESVLLSVIFCGYGFGQFGQWGAAQVSLIAIAVWLIMEIFSYAWLQKFQQGPLEYLLKIWVR